MRTIAAGRLYQSKWRKFHVLCILSQKEQQRWLNFKCPKIKYQNHLFHPWFKKNDPSSTSIQIKSNLDTCLKKNVQMRTRFFFEIQQPLHMLKYNFEKNSLCFQKWARTGFEQWGPNNFCQVNFHNLTRNFLIFESVQDRG